MSADQPRQPTAPVIPSAFAATDREELEALRAATLGDYDIAGELGRGGMATVYLAHDIALDRKVAVKVMSPALSLGDGVERFRREAKTAASLSHPNIIPIYAVRHSERLLYFVMKYVDGRSLDSIIRELGPLPIPMVQAILGQAASAFGYAHRRGVVHRDIKPGNILIDDEGWAIITDFGIAKVSEAEQLTSTGLSVGTPTYMSPEQVAAQPVTGASDQYSLGVVAYEMLTGKPPFVGGGMMAMMYAHVHQEPAPIEELRPDCPEGLREAVTRMMAKDPADRWPSVEDVIAAVGSPTVTPDDPTRSQLIAIAKTGERRAIGVTTPKSPIPLMRTPVPLAPTPRTGGVMTGAAAATTGPAPTAAAGPAKPRTPLLQVLRTGAAAATNKARVSLAAIKDRIQLGAIRDRLALAVPAIRARLPRTPRALALAGGGLVATALLVVLAVRGWSGKHVTAAESGAVPQAVATSPAPEAPPVVAPQPAAEQAPPPPAPSDARPAESGPKKTGGKAAQKAKAPVAAPDSVVAAAPSPSPSAEPAPETPKPAPAEPARTTSDARAVSGASALLGSVGSPAPAAQSRTSGADRKAVEAAIRAYATALEAGSAPRARQAFPGMSDAQLTNLESFFGSGGKMVTAWKVSDVTVEGDQATARVRGTTRVTPGGGNPALDTVDVRTGLERGAEGWRLRTFGGQAAR